MVRRISVCMSMFCVFCLCVVNVFTDCRIRLFSCLAARLFNKLTRYSLGMISFTQRSRMMLVAERVSLQMKSECCEEVDQRRGHAHMAVGRLSELCK